MAFDLIAHSNVEFASAILRYPIPWFQQSFPQSRFPNEIRLFD
jgi:hypothetical protein